MKIVIDIPDDEYKILMEAEGSFRTRPVMHIQNSTPLAEVIEDIKAEINELSELNHIEPTYEDCKRDVLEIIEKHTSSAKESEEEICTKAR